MFKFKLFLAGGTFPSACILWANELSFPGSHASGHGGHAVFSTGLPVLCLILLVLLAVLAACLIRCRRDARREMDVFRKLPIRFFAVAKDERILMSHSGDGTPDRFGTLKDVGYCGYEEASALVRDVFRTGEMRQADSPGGESGRTLVFSKLPAEMFGEEAVLCVLQNAPSGMENELMAERLDLTLHAIGDAVITTDAEERVTMLNPAASRLTGVPAEKAVGKKLDEIFNIVSSLDGGKVPSPVRRALTEGCVVELANHTDLISSGGERYHIADSAAPVRDRSGKIIGAILVFRDVTAEYESRDRLLLNNELLQSAAAMAHVEYFHYDLKTGEVMIHCKRYWPEADGKPGPARGWVMDEDVEAFESEWRKLKEGTIPSLEFPYRTLENGKVRYYVIWAARRSGGENGNAEQMFGIIQDVTDLEENIRNSHDANALLNTMLENFPNPVLVKDVADDFRYVVANRSFASFFDKTPADIVGKTDFELFPNVRDAEQFRKDDERVVAAAGGVVKLEDHFQDVAGNEHDALTNKTVIRRSDGRLMLVAVGVEVSDLKRTQRQAEEANLILQALLDNVPVGIAAKDPDSDFRHVVWNKWLEEKTGYSAGQVIGRTDFEIAPYPAMQQIFRNADLQTLTENSVSTCDEYPGRDGKNVILQTFRRLLTLSTGKRLVLSLSLDITGQKRLETEREEMIGRLQRLVEYERITNRCLQDITLQTEFSDSVNFMLREIGETLGGDRSYIFQYMDDYRLASNTYEWTSPETSPQIDNLKEIDMTPFPELLETLSKKNELLIDDLSAPPPEFVNSVYFLEMQEIRSILIVGIWMDGRLWGFLGVDYVKSLRTFTESDKHILHNAVNLFLLAMERERRMNALADNRFLQKQIFDNITIPILLMDRDFKVVTANTAIKNFYREHGGDSAGETCFQCYCHSDSPPADCPAMKVFKSGRQYTTERIIQGRRIQINAQPIFDRDGEMVYVLEAGFDITELHNQKMILEQNNQLLAAYLEQDKTVNECLEMLVLSSDFHTALRYIITRLGVQLEFDACGVFRYDPSLNALFCVEKWASDEGASGRDFQNVMSASIYPACLEALLNHRPLEVDLRQKNMLPEQLELKPYLEHRGMQAIFCVGIWFRGTFWGHVDIEFASQEKEIGNVEKRLLYAAGRIIEVLIEQEDRRRQLARSENEKDRIWELMTIPLVLFDSDRNIVRVNPAAERLAGKTSAEMVDHPCYHSLCLQPSPPSDCPVDLTLRTGKSQQVEFTLRGREFQVCTLPVFEKGVIVNVLQSYIDVTDENENKRRLLRAIEAAKAADRAKSTFLATMSHEIRTPLNAVIGFSELLKTGALSPEEQTEYFQSINFAGNTLLNLINDVLDLSKIEADQLTIIPAEMDFAVLCKEIYAIFSLRAEEKNLQLNLLCPEDMPHLFLDALRMRQVLLNLVGNAVKFTNRGGITVSVSFEKTGKESGTLTVKVADTGIGVSEEFQRKIFEPFVQNEDIRGSRSYEGTGLGLTISKRLVECMNGSLRLESERGKGSCFSVILENIRFAAQQEGEKRSSAVEKTKMDSRIFSLLVDDVEMNLKVLSAMFRKLELPFECALSGSEALLLLEKQEFSLVFTDMWMPGMDGSALAAEIRKRYPEKKIALIALTADTEMAGHFSLDCFDAILLKPVTMARLKKTMTLFEQDKLVSGSGEPVKI